MYKNSEIFLDAPNIGDLEKEYVVSAIDSGYVSSIGKYVDQFETSFSKYLGAKKSVSTQSGTAALHASLYSLGIQENDEVIVPAMTFIATVNPIIYLKAKPIFVDIDKNTWNIDAKKIEEKITKKTKAIIPVHLYGNPCDMDEIKKVSGKFNIKVIEDATESLGASYKRKYTGTIGDLGCFSFNGNKIITTGGGGMVSGNNKRLLTKIKSLVNQSKSLRDNLYHTDVGFNYRMTNIESALGLAQMEKLDYFLLKKREFNKIYQNELVGIKSIKFQESYFNSISSYWLNAITIDDIDIIKFQQYLSSFNIPTRRFFYPITEFPPYKKFKTKDLKNSYEIYKKGICLPSSTLNSYENIYYVCNIIKKFFD